VRLIAKIDDQKKAEQFLLFLQGEGIKCSEHARLDLNSKLAIEIWIESEDDLEKANHWYQEFTNNPDDPRFKVQPDEVQIAPLRGAEMSQEQQSDQKQAGPALGRRPPPPPARAKRAVTNFILVLCIAIYGMGAFASLTGKATPAQTLGFGPTFLALSYDQTPFMEEMAVFANKYNISDQQKLVQVEGEAKEAFEKILKTPRWEGLYHYLKLGEKARTFDGDELFIKLRQGQAWRLISPCILHGGFLHILFNMLWLVLLGVQIEQRLKWWKYLLLSLILGIVSNTLQYLMSGPHFLGYSGVICGLAGFILSRQMVAPWEGYPLTRGTIIFLGFYIVLLLAMSVTSFFLAKLEITQMAINIANTAHISGAILGLILGRWSFFAKEVV
jgi:GlpG protein